MIGETASGTGRPCSKEFLRAICDYLEEASKECSKVALVSEDFVTSILDDLPELMDECLRLKRCPELFLGARIRKNFFARVKKSFAQIRLQLNAIKHHQHSIAQLQFGRDITLVRPNFLRPIPAECVINPWSFFLGNQIRNLHLQNIILDNHPRGNFAPFVPQAQHRLRVLPPGALNLFNRWMNDYNSTARTIGVVSKSLIKFRFTALTAESPLTMMTAL